MDDIDGLILGRCVFGRVVKVWKDLFLGAHVRAIGDRDYSSRWLGEPLPSGSRGELQGCDGGLYNRYL